MARHTFLFLFLFVFTALQRIASGQFNVSRCVGEDLATQNPCTPYGYDYSWTVYTIENGINKYIAVHAINATADGTFNELPNKSKAVWPPPTIRIKKGQRIRIRLFNQLSDPTEKVTLHFHGLLQTDGYNTMDGPQGITQSPVLKGDVFTYDFPVNQAGTFWVHSHATGQYPKGLRSPLIVSDTAEPAQLGYDGEYDHTVTLSDWWPNFWNTLDLYQKHTCAVGVEVPAGRIIMNDDVPEWGRSGFTPMWTIPAGKRGRLRFINMSAFQRFYVHLDTKKDDDFVVVEIDGVLVDDRMTSGIEIASGQRVSVIVKGPDASKPWYEQGPARKIIVVGDPRVSISSSTKNECVAKYPTYSPGSNIPAIVPSKTQYTYGWINNHESDALNDRRLLALADLQYSTSPLRADYVTWTRDDKFGLPCYAGRPRLSFTDETRSEKVTIERSPGKYEDVNILIPKFAYQFNEFSFVPRVPADETKAWFVKAKTETYMHAILLNDTYGIGTMNVRRWGYGYAETASFPVTEASDTGAPGTEPNFDRQHSLMQALHSSNGVAASDDPRNSLKKYQVPSTYSAKLHVKSDQPSSEKVVEPWSHTIVINSATDDEVHWFIIRARRGDHPFHMHGHEFQLLAKLPVETAPKDPYYPEEFNFGTSDGGADFYNQIYQQVEAERGYPWHPHPPRRDTLFIEKGWDYVIAIKADNPGAWAIHCHNDFHAESGMFMQMIENPEKLRKTLGTWKRDSEDTEAGCVELGNGPLGLWITKMGAISSRFPFGQSKIWEPLAQTLRNSWKYYGCQSSADNIGDFPIT